MNWKPIEQASRGSVIIGGWYDHEWVCMEMWWDENEWKCLRGDYWCPPTHYIDRPEPPILG